jgi:hypothetical protein
MKTSKASPARPDAARPNAARPNAARPNAARLEAGRPPPVGSPGRRLRDALLLPLALILVPIDWALREGSRALRRWRPVRRLEALLAGWPAWAILPLFLIPEAIDHAGGFYAAYLLAHRKVLAATAVAVFVKGTGLLIALWIYQACRPALMTIRWFAWAHGKVEAARDWALDKVGPAWSRARRYLRRLVLGRTAADGEPGAAHAGRRLAAIRLRLLKRLSRTG